MDALTHIHLRSGYVFPAYDTVLPPTLAVAPPKDGDPLFPASLQQSKTATDLSPVDSISVSRDPAHWESVSYLSQIERKLSEPLRELYTVLRHVHVFICIV